MPTHKIPTRKNQKSYFLPTLGETATVSSIMKGVNKYLDILTEIAERKLKKQFKIDKLDFDSLGFVNSYLIYQAIKDKKFKKNTLINFPDKETKSEFYIPVIITLSLHSFIDNYILSERLSNTDNELYNHFFSYQFNIDLDKMPITFKSKSIIVTEKQYENKLKKFTSSLFYLSIKKLKKLIDTNSANKLKPIEYKIYDNREDFLNDIIEIIGKRDTNFFKEELFNCIENDIHKAFPFQYIAKTGKNTNNIPIDPMIYIVNDYQTARTHILDKRNNISNVIFIGANKYKDCHLEISEDLNSKRIENCLLIGSADISENAIPNLYKWKWTLSELNHFNYFTTYPINKILVENEHFSDLLKDFDCLLTQIENDHGIILEELYRFVRNILPVIIPSTDSRLITQLDNTLIYFRKAGEDIVETAFYEIDEYDYEEIWEEILIKFALLIDCKKESHLKFKKIQEFDRIDYLIVPKEYLQIWNEEVNKVKIRNIISFKDFEQLSVKNKTIVFLGFFGYNHLKSMLYNSNKINIILYSQEDDHFKNCFNRFKRETYNELKSSDRKVISDISFRETEKIENIEELIKRLFEKDEETKIDPDYSETYSTDIYRELTFENDTETLELDENKTVLLKTNRKEYFEKVKNLTVGDKIRVYDNSSKEELYQVALEFDTNGEFMKIEGFSSLWKTELRNYYLKFKSLDELYQHLVSNGLSIKNKFTLRNWINIDSDVKFPQSKKDLSVLKKSINSILFNEKFSDILKSRRLFNGIMIALGRDFSDEISDYIRNKRKGELLKQFSDRQIQQFVDQNAKERTIKTIKAIDNE